MNFIKVIIMVTIIVLVLDEIDNDHYLSVHKPKNSAMPQFSWKRRSGEVVELADTMPRNEEGVIQSSRENWFKAILKKRPELSREFGHDQAIQALRMQDTVKQLDAHSKGEPVPEIDRNQWYWK